jgi:hypothetical protein
MSYHGLGFTLNTNIIPGVPGVTQGQSGPTVQEQEIAAKVAARDAARDAARLADQAKRDAENQALQLQREAEDLAMRDRSLPAQPDQEEDWTPVPGAETVLDTAPEQKIPWLLLGVGGVAVLGIGYWLWKR